MQAAWEAYLARAQPLGLSLGNHDRLDAALSELFEQRIHAQGTPGGPGGPASAWAGPDRDAAPEQERGCVEQPRGRACDPVWVALRSRWNRAEPGASGRCSWARANGPHCLLQQLVALAVGGVDGEDWGLADERWPSEQFGLYCLGLPVERSVGWAGRIGAPSRFLVSRANNDHLAMDRTDAAPELLGSSARCTDLIPLEWVQIRCEAVAAAGK